MSVTAHERPGVYSSYDASSVTRRSQGSRVIGIAAKAAKGTVGEVVTVTGYESGRAVFGEDSEGGGMTGLLRLLYENGASEVKAVRVAESGTVSDYTAAFRALAESDSARIVVTDSALTVTCPKWEKSFPLDALVFTMSYSCAASLTVIAATETDYLTMTCSCGYLLNKSGKYVLRPFYAINKRLMDLNPNHINYVRNKRYRKKNPFTVPTNVFEAEFDTPRVTKLIDRLREQYRFR